jgi:hypothetical protein
MSSPFSITGRVVRWWRRDWPLVFILALCVVSFAAGWHLRKIAPVAMGRCPASGVMMIDRVGNEFVARCLR